MQARLVASEQALEAERTAHHTTREQLDAAKNAVKLTTLQIEKLKAQLARLRRMKFGQSSERLTLLVDQLELTLEDLEAEHAHAACVVADGVPPEAPQAPGRRPRREPLPAHLPRHEVIHPAPQADVSKFADHLPLYRQSQIYAREGVNLSRSTLADWLGQVSWLLQPLVDRIAAHVTASPKLHADDTPVPVLAPGTGKTATGRLWVYLRDNRRWRPSDKPAALFRYSPDRKGERPREHLKAFTGFLQADAYAGFERLYDPDRKPGPITPVACWAHARRKLHDVYQADPSSVAAEGLRMIRGLYEVERGIAQDPHDDRRKARKLSKLTALDFFAWADGVLGQVSARTPLAEALRYAVRLKPALLAYTEDGRLEIDNNLAENALRGIAVGRKNWMFAGADCGGERAAAMYSLLETAKLNGVIRSTGSPTCSTGSGGVTRSTGLMGCCRGTGCRHPDLNRGTMSNGWKMGFAGSSLRQCILTLSSGPTVF